MIDDVLLKAASFSNVYTWEPPKPVAVPAALERGCFQCECAGVRPMGSENRYSTFMVFGSDDDGQVIFQRGVVTCFQDRGFTQDIDGRNQLANQIYYSRDVNPMWDWVIYRGQTIFARLVGDEEEVRHVHARIPVEEILPIGHDGIANVVTWAMLPGERGVYFDPRPQGIDYTLVGTFDERHNQQYLPSNWKGTHWPVFLNRDQPTVMERTEIVSPHRGPGLDGFIGQLDEQVRNTIVGGRAPTRTRTWNEFRVAMTEPDPFMGVLDEADDDGVDDWDEE